MIYGISRMIYLLRKHDVISVPFICRRHMKGTDIIEKAPSQRLGAFYLEQGTGVEPAFTAWEAVVLPIYEPCRCAHYNKDPCRKQLEIDRYFFFC